MWTKKPYLCGTMIGKADNGAGWRKSMRRWFTQYGVSAYDPCIEESSVGKIYDIKDVGKTPWENLPQPLQEAIVKKDIRQIRYGTSCVVCYFTKYSTGTVSELTAALCANIPVFIVTSRRLCGWPGTTANCDGNRVFSSFETLKRFLVYKYRLKRVKG